MFPHTHYTQFAHTGSMLQIFGIALNLIMCELFVFFLEKASRAWSLRQCTHERGMASARPWCPAVGCTGALLAG